MAELDFGNCLTLLLIGFFLGLICIRCLLAVVNRAFQVVDYAKAELTEIIPGAGGKGGKFGIGDFVGMILQSIAPGVQAKIQGFMGVAPQLPKAK